MHLRLGTCPGALPSWRLKKHLPALLAVIAGVLGLVGWAEAQPMPTTPSTPVQPMTAPKPPGDIPTTKASDKPSDKSKETAAKDTAAKDTAAKEPEEKRITLNFKGANWEYVLNDWFAKESGLMPILNIVPQGSVTIQTPPGKKYTIGEVVDLLNEALQAKKLILVRRHVSFFIHPADETIDFSMVPRVDVSELPKRGRSEIVQVLIPLSYMTVEESAPEIKRLLTPIGQISSLAKTNTLVIADAAGNVQKIYDMIQHIEEQAGQGDSYTHVCKYKKAQEIADVLKTHLSDASVTVTGTTPAVTFQQPFGGFGFQQPGFPGMPGGNPGGPGGDRGDRGDRGNRGGNNPGGSSAVRGAKSVTITVDPKANSVTVVGPPEKIQLAKKLVEDNDKGIVPINLTDPFVRRYTVPAGTADSYSKLIKERNPTVSVISPNTSELLVYGNDDDHKAIQKIIGETQREQASIATAVIDLYESEASEMVNTLSKLFPPVAGGPVIQAQVGNQPAILVKGTLAQIEEVKNTVRSIERTNTTEKPGVPGGMSRRVISIPEGSASLLADKLAQMMSAMGNEVRVFDPNRPPQFQVAPPPPGSYPAPSAPSAPVPAPPGKQSLAPKKSELLYINAQIVDPNQPQPKSDKKPIIIQVKDNQLILTSEDAAALDLLASFARYYTSGKPQDNLFKVYRLRNTLAEDAAKTITEIFNGPQQQGGGRGAGGLFGGNPGLGLLANLVGGGGGNQPAGAAATNPNRIRVVAERSSNSLVVVKSSPVDLLAIEMLLKDYIDRGVTEDTISMRHWVLQIRYADATEIGNSLRSLYRTQTMQSAVAPSNPVPFVAPQAQVSAKPPELTITVDDRTNKVILLCTENLYRDIKNLVESELDVSDVANPEAVRIISLKGIDPTLVQQAIDAFQGRNPLAAQMRNGFNNNNRGGFPGGGFAGGAFGGGPGGFGGGPGAFGGGPGGGFGGNFGGGGGPAGFGGMGAGAAGGMRGGMGGPGMGGGGGGPGGGRPGGAAPGGGRGGGGRQASAAGAGMEGPSNFDDRGMDAPLAPISSTLFDPMIEGTEPRPNTTFPMPHNVAQILPISGQFPAPQQPQPVRPMLPPNPPGQIVPPTGTAGNAPAGTTAPRGLITAYSLPGLDQLVLRAENAQDLQIIIDLIERLRELSRAALPRLQVVQLENIDCNYAADFLTQLFSRIVIASPSGIYLTQPTQFGPGQVGGGGGFGGLAGNAIANRGFYFLALPQLNAMLIVGPESRFDDVLKEVRKIDVKNSPMVRPRSFRLEKASAQIVATQIQTFFNARFPGLPQTKSQFRVTFDIPSNTVFVQASPADMEDVEALIKELDTFESQAINDIKIFSLRQADAAGLAQVLVNALSVNTLNPLAQETFTGPIVQTAGGTAALAGAGFPGAGAAGFGGAAAGLGAAAVPPAGFGATGVGTGATTNVQVTSSVPTLGTAQQGGLSTRSSSIRLKYREKEVEMDIVSGLLSDVHLVPNVRTNQIIVLAPAKTMKLIEILIEKLDTVAAAAAYVKVITLKVADATLTANLLRTLFTGATTGATGGAGGAGGVGGGGAAAGGTSAGTNPLTTTRPLLTTPGESPSAGATLVGLQIATDDRTNSIIVAGAQNDLDTIDAIIAKLESSATPDRYYDVYKLRNAAAADVATALTTFIANSLAVLTGTNYNSTYIQLQKNVVIVAEPVSNTLLISATPFYFMEMKRIIERMDAQPPQVMIQVLIAQVTLTNDEEFGIQVGGQSPILFARGGLSTPAAGGLTDGGTNAAIPGFNFNTTNPLGNSSLNSPGQVGFQGLSNLGVGLSSPTAGVGGFIFQASSQSFSLLIRALQSQGRIDIVSRPQVMVTDNQTGFVQVGANYPYLSASILTGVGTSSQSVEYYPIGVTMRVTPRVNPDGKVLMRVEPQIASVSAAPVSLGNGVQSPAFNISTVQTTVLASSGETIVLGGLIQKNDSRSENGMPFLKDLPWLGALFRYRSHTTTRTETLLIMTPYIVRSEIDNARILAEESARVHGCVQDWARIHGHGMEVIGPAVTGARVVPTNQLAPGGGWINGTPSNQLQGPTYFGDWKSEAGNGPMGSVGMEELVPGNTRGTGFSDPSSSVGNQQPGMNRLPPTSNVQLPLTNLPPQSQPQQGQPAPSQFFQAQPSFQSQPMGAAPTLMPGGQPYNPAAMQMPTTAQPPLAQPANQQGAMNLPGQIPGVPMPPVPTGSLNAVQMPSNVTLTGASSPVPIPNGQNGTMRGNGGPMPPSTAIGPTAPPAASTLPGGQTYRMAMPNGQPPPGGANPRYPGLPDSVFDSHFMQMQPKPPQQPQQSWGNSPPDSSPPNR